MPTINSWGNQVLNANVLFNGGTFGAGTDATSGAINIGTGAATRVVTLGNSTGHSQIILTAGDAASTWTTTNGSLTLSTGSGALGLGTDGAAKIITVGNIIGATTVAINTGTGGMAVASASGTLMNVTGSGIVTKPLQPCFLAYRSVTVASVTGDNTLYQIINDTEAFDLGSNYNNGTGVFTAPVTGRYLFCTTVAVNGFGTQTNGAIGIVTTARTYNSQYFQWGLIGVSSGTCQQSFTTIADMSANDTAHFIVQIGGGTKTLGITGGGTIAGTYCSGVLLC